MYLDSAKKAEIFAEYGASATDTGSCESQIALLTYRIQHLTEHVKANHKDFVTNRALVQLVGQRRRFLPAGIHRFRRPHGGGMVAATGAGARLHGADHCPRNLRRLLQ